MQSSKLAFWLLLFFSHAAHHLGYSTYTTPGTGVSWNLDSLAERSGGALTGAFPSYTVNDEIAVAINDRVTFPPGSILTVTQGSGKGFTVYGVLQAIGTAIDSIVIKGSADSAGWYRGVRFDDTSVDSLCIVSYCKISNATDGVYCFNANTTIANCTFTRNSSSGVRCYGASPIIRNCVFTLNRQTGITANVNSSPLIENNLLTYNNYQNTSAYNAIAIGGQGTNSPIIRGNEIYNRTYYRSGAIGLSTLTGSDVCNALIENNYLHDNNFGVATTAFSAGGTIRPMIRYNRIENNRLNPNPLTGGSGITMYYGGPTNSPTITGNIIRNNYWGVTVIASSGFSNSPQPNLGNLGNADTSDDGWNIFENNNNGGRIYQLYNNASANILAQNNYWGSADSATIESWIVHQPDSAAFGFVQYRPYGNRGFGRPTTFGIHQESDSLVRLRWRFASTSQPGGIRLYKGDDSLHLGLIAELAPLETSYVVRPPIGLRQYYGLSSFNRFGIGDTMIQSFGESDTSLLRYFPMDMGNIWQYYATSLNPEPPDSNYYLTARIIGDTLLSNGRRYKQFINFPYRFIRIDSSALRVVGYQPFGACQDSEDVLFRLSLDSLLYHNCRGILIRSDTGRAPVVPGGPIGRFQRYVWFEAMENDFRLAEGVGINYFRQWELAGWTGTLIAALVNGIQYGTFVGVGETNGRIPLSVALEQNYPNPFNPSTIIEYQLPEPSHVTLTVYNTLGQQVATLVNGVEEPGYKSVQWDASGVASGVYFYRIQAGTFTATKKLIVLR